MKSKVAEADIKTAEIVNNLRVERMVRTCASLAEEETQYFKDQYASKKDMFI